jgi:hypothetical protein
MTIAIAWHAQSDGPGIYDSTAMFRDMVDLYEVAHYGAWFSMPENIEGAVVVVHGGREHGRLDKLNEDIKNLQWCIIVALGDEESVFPVEKIEHPHKKVWVQEPMPGRHDFADRFMICGYGHDRKRHIVKVEKDLDWFLGAQITHERRIACVDALRKINWGGVIIESRGYYQGVQMSEYVRMLCRAKIVPCPSGPFSPDAARPWDALQAGSIPILDDLSPTRKEPGFWQYVLGGHPYPVVTDWSVLPGLIENLKLGNIERRAKECLEFWETYKWKFSCWLKEDLKDLGVECTRTSLRL